MTKAKREWAVGEEVSSGNKDDAVGLAWRPIESLLRRMVKSPALGKNADIRTIIDEAYFTGFIDRSWHDRLHDWRIARNHAEHDSFALRTNKLTLGQYLDIGYSLVDGAPGFFAYIASKHAPQQLALETQDELVLRLADLVTKIQQGTAVTRSGKPLGAIRFHPEQDRLEVLALQLLMVLRDVRFYVPEEYRWSTSPIVSKFSVDAIGWVPQGMFTSTGNRLRLPPGDEMRQLLGRFDRIVQHECGDMQPAAFLRERIEDGIRLENGNYHAGIKLNPRDSQ